LRRAASAQDIVRIAVEHLAETLDVPRDQIEVVRVEDAYWEDKTLGCPRPPGKYPDRAYPKPIPGYLILLAYNNEKTPAPKLMLHDPSRFLGWVMSSSLIA
jgi:hypothetical protein